MKWEGYEEKNNTWEPLTNLSSCVTMIADYENELERIKYIQRYGYGKSRGKIVGYYNLNEFGKIKEKFKFCYF